MTPSSSDPVPLRSPTTSGDPSRIRATSSSSCAVSLLNASTFWRTLTIKSVSSRRATKSKHSPRSPCGRERKNPVFARPRRVSSRTRSRFITHSSCGLLYKFHGDGFPPAVFAGIAANPLSRSRPSPCSMAGELVDDRVIVDDPAEASGVYNRGFFGSPRPGGGPELNLLGRAEEAAAVRKTLLLGLVDEESDLTYYSVREAHPRGHPPATLRKTNVVVHFLGDRAVVIDEVQAKTLHEAGFFGKIVGRRLQLSLLETAYPLKAGLVEVREADTDRPIRLARLIKESKATQPDFELRLQAYEDLTGRGVISKTGFKYGSHFRAYEGDPETHHAKYLVHVVPKGHRGAWPEISRAVRLAHGVKKQILFGEVGDGVRYVKLERVRP